MQHLTPSPRGRTAQVGLGCRLVLAFVMLAWGGATYAAAYSILNLGVLPDGASSITANGGLNASGQVVGFSSSAGTSSTLHAYRTSANSAIGPADDLGSYDAGGSWALGINGVGQVTGFSYLGSSATHAFRVNANETITAASDLGTLGGIYSIGRAINKSGQIVGDSSTAAGLVHAFRIDANSTISSASDLGTLGGSTSYAPGINRFGTTVGYSNITGNSVHHAFRTLPNGKITVASDLGTFGGSNSAAEAINDAGQVVGNSDIAGDSIYHAFRTLPNGSITAASDIGTLGTYSLAEGINSLGQTVGRSGVPGPNGGVFEHAFFADTAGAMQDLNDLIPPGTGWYLRDATAINDAGQIAGYGDLPGIGTQAFLLTPTPEPAGLGLLGAAAVAGLARLRRPGNRSARIPAQPRAALPC